MVAGGLVAAVTLWRPNSVAPDTTLLLLAIEDITLRKHADQARDTTIRALRGSRPTIGSSMITTFGLCNSAEAITEAIDPPEHRKYRLFLMPHCLKHAEGCPADYDEFGLDCKKCGACSVADFKTKAEDLGYKVLVSEGTPIAGVLD